jgi:hypothetical protein
MHFFAICETRLERILRILVESDRRDCSDVVECRAGGQTMEKMEKMLWGGVGEGWRGGVAGDEIRAVELTYTVTKINMLKGEAVSQVSWKKDV